MSRIFKIIDQLKNKLEGLQPLKPEFQSKLDKKFRLEFNYNSNHLEGNTLTYGETELLLIFDDTKGNHTLREYEEMKSHDVAYQLVEDWAKELERPLSEQNIKNLNEIILVRPFWKEAITADGQNTRRLISIGNYKQHANSVRLANGEIFDYASPTDTPFKMQELIEWYKTEETITHPVTLAAMLHYKFVIIHPFDDGNGRVSRLLMNYVLLKHGFPPIIIKSEDKQNYLNALHLADVGDFEAFMTYIAYQVKWSLELSIKAANGESLDEPGDLEKKLSVLKKKLKQDKEIKVKLDSNVFQDTFFHKVSSLALKWEKRLKDFDSLFFSRTITLETQSETINGLEIDDNLFNEFYHLICTTVTSLENMGVFKFYSNFKGLKTVNVNTVFAGGHFEIEFHQNVYEINYSGSSSKISKFYDEELTEEEINLIVDSIANWFYTQIEKAIEAK